MPPTDEKQNNMDSGVNTGSEPATMPPGAPEAPADGFTPLECCIKRLNAGILGWILMLECAKI